ncbi:hypothetical protein CDR19_14580 [Ectopseudomonas toyotomiensis]|uniref:Uncharacterized protein n=1 Tax=Ectopseudomonas toyotomiensis TaxID=554344 RepID=A0A1I5SAJ9_9GAMM|nr:MULTISPECIES: hypothetical protein [Pseudomonas]PIA71308.1 hypothetical protein CDR19_14580 [Pseudomonas toyotomiensis]SDA79010.1 hypothetical protein SAMN03159475_4195 [Pseudomonas sp. NFPP33]SFP67296.1 hypothetical protein SAMN05216177_104140 [Pseudomonas toyotomiensis]
MSAPNYWRELLATPTASAVDKLSEHAERLERLACIAECQGERLNSGIAAIGELLDGATGAGHVDDGVAVAICSMLAALAGLSAELATVTRNAHVTLAGIRTTAHRSPTTPYLSPVSQD